jgi:BON domain
MLNLGRQLWLVFLFCPMLLSVASVSAEPVRSDTVLAIQIRKALQEDRTLSSLNIGVRVRQGVVTLWGTVPSTEVAREVEKRARGVRGLRELRSELTIVAPPEDEPPPLPGFSPTIVVPAIRSTEEHDSPHASVSLFAPTVAEAPPPRDELPARVEQLRYTDVRYRHVQAEVQGHVVVVRALPTYTDDLMRFAQAVAKVPGVERVVVEPVRR